MTPIIYAIFGLILVIGVLKLVQMWRYAPTQPVPTTCDVSPMTNKRALEWALGLVAFTFLSIGYAGMSLWFLPLIIYLTVWLPQVSRKTTSAKQSIYVSASFGAAMIISVLLQVLL
jgi:hypothetical protein